MRTCPADRKSIRICFLYFRNCRSNQSRGVWPESPSSEAPKLRRGHLPGWLPVSTLLPLSSISEAVSLSPSPFWRLRGYISCLCLTSGWGVGTGASL